ncbi:MAG: phage terminase large subunit [Acetobacteraceae bacterium]|nr:phage terminase large subunit [Acetobacteraceae bacterium]
MSRSAQRPAAHHRLLLANLEKLSRGETDRLMVLMPPGSAKSTYASILFPAWWFVHHPRSSVIGASHTATLAAYFSRRVRDTVTQHASRLGYEISSSDRAAAHWTTTTGGEYYSAGTRGSFVGRRADLVVIDDPLRSQVEADSPSLRERIWGWYQSDLATRLKPGARIVLIMTRWHEDDLGGRLLAQSDTEWTVLRLPALAEADDPLGRTTGTPLWPEWESLTDLSRKRLAVGERAWSALFQQSPQPQTGRLFDVSHLRTIDRESKEANAPVVRAWDLAATAATGDNDPDWTVGLKLARNSVGTYAILDVVRLRGSPRQIEDQIVATAAADGPTVRIGLPEDPGQAGKSQIAYLVSRLSGYHVSASREAGGKAARAAPVASQMDAGNIAIVHAKWNHAFLDELKLFPFGRKDDQVDALSRAFSMLVPSQQATRKLSIPLFVR